MSKTKKVKKPPKKEDIVTGATIIEYLPEGRKKTSKIKLEGGIQTSVITEDLPENKIRTTILKLEGGKQTTLLDNISEIHTPKKTDIPEPGIEKLHKQPRALLKTVGQSISNTTGEPGLFTLPQKIEPGAGAIANLKEELSKNTGALAFYLIQKYQENNNTPLEITNLSTLADVMNCNNHRLKLYLLYLGGYTYPIIDRDERTKELVLTNEQLFKIEFRYSQKVAEKYSVSPRGEIQGVERIGTNLLTFIKDEPLDRIVIAPSPIFIKALEGRGLGNILTVNNKFVGLILELTDIATKILCYSSSNKPSQTIAEDNLVKHLGLTKQIKRQGKPRVRATILKGLQELQDKGHIKNYKFNEATGMYSYTYSEKYVRYKESKKDIKTPL